MEIEATKAVPFLKWAGGKQGLLRQYAPYFPSLASIRHYFEPFIGSAAVYFSWLPKRATLSDCNASLIELYQMVQQDVAGVIAELEPHQNEAAYFYAVRAQDIASLTAVQRAARLIYLNKTCYNGLYRENSKGLFNVPFGRYQNPKICDKPRLIAASHALQNVALVVSDFASVLAQAQVGDFAYLDPPYDPLTPTSSFTSYSQHGFGEQDQRRLAHTIHELTDRGCKIMLSNSYTPLIVDLYNGRDYHLIPIQARRNINSKGSQRGTVTELLILNYSP